MGLSRASVSNWQLGQRIKRKNLVSCAEVGGVSAEWLITRSRILLRKKRRRRITDPR